MGLVKARTVVAWFVLATCIRGDAVGRPPPYRGVASVEQQRPTYPTVTFTTKNATKTSYTQFIEALRAQLASGETRDGIPVMRERSTVPDSERFILVELSNGAADSTVTLAVDVTDAYVVAYQTGDRSFFLREQNPNPAIVNLFPGTDRHNFKFSGSYRELEGAAGKNRAGIELGKPRLEVAISELGISKVKKNQKFLARSLIVVIQMVAEAVRFKPIENLVCDSFDSFGRGFLPNTNILALENDWAAKSKSIQQADGVVAIMLFVRRTGQPKPLPQRFDIQYLFYYFYIFDCIFIKYAISLSGTTLSLSLVS